MDFVKLFAEVMGLSTFIFAGVAQIKQFGVKGQALTYTAYAFGLVFGGVYRYVTYQPAALADWFWLVAFGMGAGFIATNVYRGVESASGKPITHELTYTVGYTDDEADAHFGGKPTE